MATRVVTPEAVLVELPTAGAATRGLAKLVDVLIDGFVVSTLTVLLGVAIELAGVSFIGPVAVAAFGMFAFLVLVPIGSELLWRGRSVGKSMMGLEVVGLDGSRETPRQVLVRGTVALVELYLSFGALALVSSTFSANGQRFGDMAAGTVVVRRRTAPTASVPVAFHAPVGFEAYVRNLPVHGLRTQDVVLVRDYLLRADELEAGASHDLALELADRIGRVIGVGRPPQVHPRTWLVCVVSAAQMQPGGLLYDAASGLAPLVTPGGIGSSL